MGTTSFALEPKKSIVKEPPVELLTAVREYRFPCCICSFPASFEENHVSMNARALGNRKSAT